MPATALQLRGQCALAAATLLLLTASIVHAAPGRALLEQASGAASDNTVVVGLLGTILELSIASSNSAPFLSQLNVVVKSITYNASVDLMNDIIAGKIDIAMTSSDNPIDRYLNFDAPLSIIGATAKLGPYAIASNPVVGGPASWAEFKGTRVAVDAVQSGFIYALFSIAAAQGYYPGLDPALGDYTLYPSGTAFGPKSRFTALQKGTINATTLAANQWFGLTYCKDKPCYAPYANITVLGAISDTLSQYVSGAIYVNQPALTASGKTPLITRFLAALILANRYFYDPANKAEVLPFVAPFVSAFQDPNIASAYYNFLQTPNFGDPVDLDVDEAGIQTAIQLRVDYQNIFIRNSGAAAPEAPLGPVDAKQLAKARPGGLTDKTIYRAARALANQLGTHGAPGP